MNKHASFARIQRSGNRCFATDLADGAMNLAARCAEIQPGQHVVIVAEDPALGWYDDEAPRATAQAIRRLGSEPVILRVGGPEAPAPTGLAGAVADADVVIYFARIGDQGRFLAAEGKALRVVVYARTAEALAGPFGRRDHSDMCDLKRRVDRAVTGARQVEVRCPLGTRLSGPGHAEPCEAPDVTVRRFPMCVPAPVCAKGLRGDVILAKPLGPSGSRVYHPSTLALPEPLCISISDGRIVDVEGPRPLVAAFRAHYRRIGSALDIDAEVVHSWHAGIHSGCSFDQEPEANPDLWVNSLFGSPNFLHFHTCGDYPPGEITWMIERPLVAIDGRELWRDGNLLV